MSTKTIDKNIDKEFIDELTGEFIYPDSDGQPMADNTLQFEWIMTIKGGLDALFKDNPTVFVAGDLLWYPVKGEPKTRLAPDVMVVLGRPKGYRGSYKQWEEAQVAPQVVFEIMSPSNTYQEMLKKLTFYTRFGVNEFYVYDPDNNELYVWKRNGQKNLVMMLTDQSWTSPLLGIRFELKADTLKIFNPDGSPFLTAVEQSYLIEKQMEENQRTLQLLEEERKAKEEERKAKEEERKAKEEERKAKEEERKAKEEERKAKEEEQAAKEEALAQLEKMKALLKSKGLDIDLENL